MKKELFLFALTIVNLIMFVGAFSFTHEGESSEVLTENVLPVNELNVNWSHLDATEPAFVGHYAHMSRVEAMCNQ